MAFLETPRFPERIAYGASGGPGFDTVVVKVSTGLESRDTSLRYPVHQWDVSQGIKDQADFTTLRAFFMAVRGRLHGWRYKDCTDFSATLSDGVVAGITSTTFQLFKRYSAGALTLDRKILKPVSPTVEIKVSGVVTAATINYTTGNLRDELKTLTAGKGPDVIYDPVGGDLAEAAFRSIAWRGRYLVVGFAQGQIPALPLNLALLKGASLVGVFWGEFAKREPGRNAAMLGQLAQWYAEGKIKPVLDSVLPMSELPQAFARMATRQVVGKVVLRNP